MRSFRKVFLKAASRLDVNPAALLFEKKESEVRRKENL
jgi:hypothetical protein